MTNQAVIPDQIHIDMIRERLWCNREFGRAAVMVGAGFSRNAEKVTPSAPDFPLWRDLAEIMFDRLYHQGDPTVQNRDERRLTETSGLNAVRLASQYRAAFGEHELDSVIRQSCPDQQHRPGWLHRCLLELPWSDVFTTNYDTLLERTQPFVHERKYDIVLDHLDIPHAMRPRIVKLHGSLDSKRPLIIDEEHYRTYPQKFAPFVNTVQQSIMENLLCLIGFSGEDPNFLYWSGWVRDNLGEYAPPIYLVTLRRFTAAEDRLFHDRNVIPIDLSPAVSQSSLPAAERHRLALSWFVENLLQGAPPNRMRWPDISGPTPCLSAGLLKDLPPPPKAPGYRDPRARDVWAPGPVDKDKMLETVTNWKMEREEYPYWIVCPRRNRDRIWNDTEHRIPAISRNLHQFSVLEQIDILFELVWRLETSLLPLFGMDTEVEQVVNKVNPYPDFCDMDGEVLSPKGKHAERQDWTRIGARWMHLVFALTRAAREAFDLTKFRLYMDLIEKVSMQDITWKARWHYEDCLFHLYRLDDNAARKRVLEWPDTTELPSWELKKASILAELGELAEAERLAEDALADIRKRENLSHGDMFLLSIEGWLMLLLDAIKSNRLASGRQFREKYRDRWEKLSTYQCNPWSELEWMDMALSVEPQEPKMSKEVKKGFDPGNRIVSYNVVFSGDTHLYRRVFALLRMLEEGGLPPTVGIIRTASKAITKPAIVGRYLSVPRSISLMIRCKTEGDLAEWFDRSRVAMLDELELRNTTKMLMQSFEQELLIFDNARAARIRGVVEAVSRICFRFSDEDLEKSFNLAIRLYEHPMTHAILSMGTLVETLLERIFYAMSEEGVLEKTSVLLSLPLPTKSDSRITDPITCVEWPSERQMPDQFDRSSWDSPVADLISMVRREDPEVRRRAVLRMHKLHEMNVLRPSESEEFGVALWSQLQPQMDLPANTGLRDFAFLTLPEPTPGRAKNALRQKIMKGRFQQVVQRDTTGITVGWGSGDEFLEDLLGSTVSPLLLEEKDRKLLIDWNQEEAIEILNKAVTWWNGEKDELKHETGSGWGIAETLRERLWPLVRVLRDVVLPRIPEAPEQAKEKAVDLIHELDESDFCILSALPMVLFANPSYEEQVNLQIRHGLNSRLPIAASQSIVGILHWAVHSVNGHISGPSMELWVNLGCKLALRQQPALDTAISVSTDIVKHFPQLLEEGKINIENLLDMLDYLFVDTEYPDLSQDVIQGPDYRCIGVEEIPEYRELATELAYNLSEYLERNNRQVPDVLKKWQSRAESDPLPEVRRAWGTYNS